MRCPICKQEIKDNSKFCSKCGNKIPRCPSCGNVIEKKVRFCVFDGTPLPEEFTAILPKEVKREESASKKKRKIWILILACVVTLLLAGILSVGYILYQNGEIHQLINRTKDFETEENISEESVENDAEPAVQTIYFCEDNPSDTSIVLAELLKESRGINQFDAMIIADKNGTSAAFNTGYLAKIHKAPILLIDQDKPDEILSYIKQNLRAEGILYLLGSVNSMIHELEEKLPDIEKNFLYGQERYETNAVVLQQTDISGKEILVCNNKDYSAGICASATGNPVLMVGTTLTEEQKKLLSDNSCEIVSIGYAHDFSTEVIEELILYDEKIENIIGENVYEISVNIAKRYFDSPDSIVLVHEDNYLNSLCEAPLSFEYEAPVIILNDENLQYAADYIRENVIETCYIFTDSDSKGSEIVQSLFKN